MAGKEVATGELMGETHAGSKSELNDLLPGSIELVVDSIDERLEEIAALAAAWQRNRDKNRPSPILRKSLIYAARDLWDEFALLSEDEAG